MSTAATQKLCTDHIHLHGGKPALLGDHDACEVCKQLGYSNGNPPPRSNYDYDRNPA